MPQLINYQGRVVVQGTNYNGNANFRFALVDAGTNPSTPGDCHRHRQRRLRYRDHGHQRRRRLRQRPRRHHHRRRRQRRDGHRLGRGVVAGITVTNAGSGYTGTPTVIIAAPPPTFPVTYWSNDGTSAAGSEPTNAVPLTVSKGLYSVLLGDTALANMTAIPNSVFNNADVRLRVWFNDGPHGSNS